MSSSSSFAFAAAMLISCCGATAAMAADAAADAQSGAAPAISQNTARAMIVDDNYTNVTNMHKVGNGWAAQAKDLGAPVSLIVTNSGEVVQQ
jgi:hypothetical protein